MAQIAGTGSWDVISGFSLRTVAGRVAVSTTSLHLFVVNDRCRHPGLHRVAGLALIRRFDMGQALAPCQRGVMAGSTGSLSLHMIHFRRRPPSCYRVARRTFGAT